MATSSSGSGDDEDARSTALFDPDTVFPVSGVGGDNVPDVLKQKADKSAGEATGNGSLYAQRERARAAGSLPADVVKRIADRAERAARQRKS